MITNYENEKLSKSIFTEFNLFFMDNKFKLNNIINTPSKKHHF